MSHQRTWILTADDFGRSAEVNAAVERWHRAGALTQASLMVNEACVEEAVTIARRNPELRVGLHLTLCDGRDAKGAALPPSPGWAGVGYAFLPSRRAALQAEIAAQFAKFKALGFAPTYWDGHAHLHLHPTVLALTLPIAREHGFRFVRLVREPGPPAVLPWIFNRLSARAIPLLHAAGIGFADAVFGLRKTGHMDQAEFTRAFNQAPPGVTEIYFHPGAEERLPEPEFVVPPSGGKG